MYLAKPQHVHSLKFNQAEMEAVKSYAAKNTKGNISRAIKQAIARAIAEDANANKQTEAA